MSALIIDLAGSWMPFVLLLSGMLSAGYRARRKQSPDTASHMDVDPDIRVRVTGKIS